MQLDTIKNFNGETWDNAGNSHEDFLNLELIRMLIEYGLAAAKIELDTDISKDLSNDDFNPGSLLPVVVSAIRKQLGYKEDGDEIDSDDLLRKGFGAVIIKYLVPSMIYALLKIGELDEKYVPTQVKILLESPPKDLQMYLTALLDINNQEEGEYLKNCFVQFKETLPEMEKITDYMIERLS